MVVASKKSDEASRGTAVSEPKTGFSRRAKIGLAVLAAVVVAAVAFYFFKTRPTEVITKRIFDLGLGGKEEILETSRCTRAMGWDGSITRTCVNMRTTVNPNSSNSWLGAEKTCTDSYSLFDTIPHAECPTPIWDKADKADLISKGQEWTGKLHENF